MEVWNVQRTNALLGGMPSSNPAVTSADIPESTLVPDTSSPSNNEILLIDTITLLRDKSLARSVQYSPRWTL